MDEEKQIISEETGQASENRGIEAPSLIQDNITENEERNTKEIDDPTTKEKVNNAEEMRIAETQDEDISANLRLNDEESKGTKDGETQDQCEKNDEQTSDKRSRDESNAKYEDVSKTAQRSNSEEEKDTSYEVQLEKTRDTAEENGNMKSNGNHFVEVKLVENNNNSSDGKNGVRRARFSSEIIIQPKAYFQAGTDSVVMMPPSGSSESDDVFKEETTQPGMSPSVLLKAEPSNAVLPQTFLPLTVFSCLFCCPMIGLFAVYKSYSVRQFIKKGEMRRANEASQHARQLGVLTLFIGFFFILTIIIIAVLVSVLT